MKTLHNTVAIYTKLTWKILGAAVV